ncbi:DUF3795 domain-containing protein [bacterium]
MLISACGLVCDQCQFFGDTCQGCLKVKGKTFWALEATESGICQLYQCAVHEKGYTNCGACDELPCDKFLNLKDPNVSETEHQEMIKQRVILLKQKVD